MKSKLKKLLEKILNTYLFIGVFIIIIGTILLLFPFLQNFYFLINEDALVSEQNNVSNLVDEIVNTPTQVDNTGKFTPQLDTTLTETNTLIIPSIGVIGKINESNNSIKGLDKGLWRVTDWGSPTNGIQPIIIAAHRFGYVTWSNKFRKENSFLNLPKTKVGDRVEIIWEQRRYIYKIYKTEENTKITDYKADLILYTCKYLNSNIRVFRYAKLIKD